MSKPSRSGSNQLSNWCPTEEMTSIAATFTFSQCHSSQVHDMRDGNLAPAPISSATNTRPQLLAQDMGSILAAYRCCCPMQIRPSTSTGFRAIKRLQERTALLHARTRQHEAGSDQRHSKDQAPAVCMEHGHYC